MQVAVCQTCGVSGYAELLVFCNNCQISAEHRYCLDKLPSQHEVISWSCEQCKPRPSMVNPTQRRTKKHLKCQFKQTKRIASMENIRKRHENNAGFPQSSLILFEKHSKNKRRKLILLENESAEATKDKLLEVQIPKNLTIPRGRLISDGGHLDEEIHANSTCQNSPVKNSCQLLALSQVEIEKTRQNTFLSFDLSVQLLRCPVWSGCFDVRHEELGPLKACLSIKACEKVCNIVTKLPPVLQMTKLSRNEWPTSFNNLPPNDDSIALCFFSENSNAGAAFHNLLDHITMKDLALRVVLDEAEMLVFSSIILPEYCQRFEERYYMWGAFRSRQDNSEPCAPTKNCLDSHKVRTIRHFPPGFRHATEQCDNAEKIKTRDFPPGFTHATEQCDNAENCNIVEQSVDKSKNSKNRDCSQSACSENQVNIDINLHHHPAQICSKPTADEKMSQYTNLEHVCDSERREYNGSACSKSQVNIHSNMHHSDVPICSHPTAEGISRNMNFEHTSDSKRPEYNGSECSKSPVNVNSNMRHHPEQICPNPCDEGRTSGNRIIVHSSDSKRLDSENHININSNMDHLAVQICPNPPAEERASGNRNFEHASDSKKQNYDGSACSKSQVNILPNIHHQISPIYTNPTAEERMSQNRNFEHASDSKRLEYNGNACSESQVNINLNMHPHPGQVCPNPSAEQSTPQNTNFAHACFSKRRDCSRSLSPESQVNIDLNMHHHPVQICPNPTTEERMSQNRNIANASDNCYDFITDDCRTVKQQLANNSNSLEERVVQCLDGNPFSEISDDSSNEITKDRKLPMLDSLEYQGKHDQHNNAIDKHTSTGKMPQLGKELVNLRMTENPVACILDAHKLFGFNYLDWLRNLKIVLNFEKLTYVLEHSPPAGVNDDATEEEKITLQKWRDDDLKVKYYMIASMSDELQKQYKNLSHAYEIHVRLDKLYGAKSRIRRYQILGDLIQTRMIEGSSVHDHVVKMINMVEKLEDLGIGMDSHLYIDLILQSLPESFSQFITNFLKNGIETSLRGLLNMLSNAELTTKREASGMLKGSSKPKVVEESFQKKKSPNIKTEIRMTKPRVQSEAKCFHCGKLGHLKRNCRLYITKLNKEKSRSRYLLFSSAIQ
ncbi:hypothetical protein ZIOFF_005078 [Zingiber officinale]|uniref:CCHC-type domain-containing protein n=1 Tax=Zingiber officinale TaxID=94328 RepID=A0A8J5IBV2_ZINOF|nr:hypothetical protein ZIOFF_005078 [Zingiber officinale]